MTKIMSKTREQLNEKAQCFFDESCMVQEPTVAYRHDYTAELYNDAKEYPFSERLPHRRTYLLDGNIGIDKAFHLRLPVLLENASDGSRIVGTHPKVVLTPGVVGYADTNQVGSGG